MIKQYFMWAMAAMIPVGLAIWFLFLLGKTLVSMFQDWKLHRELDQLQSDKANRQQQKQDANRARLDTGCTHDFETGRHGLPPGTCRLCGMERERPNGGCDHVWKATTGPVPGSTCEKCGRKYNVTGQHEMA